MAAPPPAPRPDVSATSPFSTVSFAPTPVKFLAYASAPMLIILLISTMAAVIPFATVVAAVPMAGNALIVILFTSVAKLRIAICPSTNPFVAAS